MTYIITTKSSMGAESQTFEVEGTHYKLEDGFFTFTNDTFSKNPKPLASVNASEILSIKEGTLANDSDGTDQSVAKQEPVTSGGDS